MLYFIDIQLLREILIFVYSKYSSFPINFYRYDNPVHIYITNYISITYKVFKRVFALHYLNWKLE